MIMRHLKNILFVIGAVLLLGSFLANYLVINSFISHPTAANLGSGETLPYEVKGKKVYITRSQYNETVTIFSCEIAGLVVFLIYGVLFINRRK